MSDPGLYGWTPRVDPVGEYQQSRDRDDALRRCIENGDPHIVASREWLAEFQRTVPRKSSFNWQGRLGSMATTKEINDVEEAFHKAGAAAQEHLRQGLGDTAAAESGDAGIHQDDGRGAGAGGGRERGEDGGGELNDPIPF